MAHRELPRTAQSAPLQRRCRTARDDGDRGPRGRRPDPDGGRGQPRRSDRPRVDQCAPRGARGRYGPCGGAAPPARRYPDPRRDGCGAWAQPLRRAIPHPEIRGRQRAQAQRQAHPPGRHRLLLRQDVHRARDGTGAALAGRRGRLPRDRPDRDPDRRDRRCNRRGGRRLHLRRGGGARAGRRPRTLGLRGGPRVALPPLVRRRHDGPHSRRSTGRPGALP